MIRSVQPANGSLSKPLSKSLIAVAIGVAALSATSAHALGLLQNLTSPLSGGADIRSEESLGSALYQDQNLSINQNQSCASCHSLQPADTFNGPNNATGFVDPENVATGSPTSRGSIDGRFGGLNSPSAGYAAFSPAFYFDNVEGLWIGGQFWNGRAATLEDQAKGPFLNPVEMAMPSKWSVVERVAQNRDYRKAFKNLYGIDLRRVSEADTAQVDNVYNKIAQSIATFERSREFNKFNSKFDFVKAGMTTYTAQEQRGADLFDGKAQCGLCHVSSDAVGADGNLYPAVFTDFTYDNIGVPRNTSIPGNPAADIGLQATTGAAEDAGKHKVMTLRNIEFTAPYGHNGYFATLEEIVHFYNTRDVASEGWGAPEVTANVNNAELGNLGLTAQEEADLVAFMKTLSDDYPEWGNDANVPAGTPSPW